MYITKLKHNRVRNILVAQGRMGEKVRLAKYLAEAGITSRRKAEQLIIDKRIAVNGQIIDQLAYNVTPETDRVELDGRQISVEEKIYLMMNKPTGVLSSVSDPHGRTTIIDLLADLPQRVYPVGRLDLDTEGLLLLTNDGDFTNLMIHPRYEIKKTYQAWVEGVVNQAAINILSEGVMLDDGITAPAGVRCLKIDHHQTLLEIIIHEGRNRQVKRMCQAVGYPVITLKRTGFAFLELKDLAEGEYRLLDRQELNKLRQLASESNLR